jgi:hypothetical protein
LSHEQLKGVPLASDDKERAGQYAASRQILTLLLRVGLYREKWEEVARNNNQRVEIDRVNQAAAAKVIAEYLYDNGHPETDTQLARQLKDKVSRALSGKGITPGMLELIVQAFGISPHDAQRLYNLYDGHIELTEIVGSLATPTSASGIRPPGHRTTLLFEHHQVGRDGLPVHHHTQQTIYSLVEGLPSYRFRFDTADAEVRIKRGGTPGPIYPIDHGYHAIDIAFPRPLGFGESQYLDYWTNFRYSSAPPQEFRRGAYQRTEHLDMRVEFHREKIPRKIWWAEWSDHLDTSRAIVRHEQLTLDEERSAHRYLDAIQHTVVGFYWEW